MSRPVIALLVGVFFALNAPAQSQQGTMANPGVRAFPLQATPQRPQQSHPPDRLLQSGHTRPIQVLAMSGDGRWLASGGYDKTVIVWNATTGEQQWKFAGYADAVTVLAFSPGGAQLVSASINGQVKTWDLQRGTAIFSANLRTGVRGAGFSADGRVWAIGIAAAKPGATARIEIHDAATGNIVRTVPTPWGTVDALTITSEGLLAASGETGEDDEEQGSVQVWKLESGEPLKSYPVIANAFSANGRYMAHIDYSRNPKSIVVSDLASGQPKHAFPAVNPGGVFLSPDGQEIVVTDPMKAELKIWSVTSGRELKTMPAEQSVGALGLNAAAFSADGKTIAAAPYLGNSIKVWEVTTGRELFRFEGQSPVQGIAVSPDGRWLVVSSQVGINLWNAATGKKVTLSNGTTNSPVFSRDGRWLATNPGVHFPGERLRVWDLKTRTVAADFAFAQGGTPVSAMAFLPPGSRLNSLGPISRSWEFTGDDGKHGVWSAPSPVASSPDGKLLVAQSGGGGNLDVWDATSGQKLTTLPAHKMSTSSLSFSSDGRLLVTTGQETLAAGGFANANRGNEWGMKVWDVATWKPRISISFVRSGAPCAAFSPDGHLVAVEKSWETVELLDTSSSASVAILTATDPQPQNHQFTSKNLAFSADGKLLFEGAQNGVRVWTVNK